MGDSLYEIEEDRNADPGWAVRLEDGSWLGGGHGLNRWLDAFYATRYKTQDEANRDAVECQDDHKDKLPYKIIEAWQPLCEVLRLHISSLRQANTFSPDVILDITMELDSILSKLRGAE